MYLTIVVLIIQSQQFFLSKVSPYALNWIDKKNGSYRLSPAVYRPRNSEV